MKQVGISILFFWLVIQACSFGSRWNLIANPIRDVTVIYPEKYKSAQHKVKGDLSCDWAGKAILIDNNKNRNELPADVVIVSQINEIDRAFPWRLFMPIGLLLTAYVTIFILPMFRIKINDK